MGAQHFWEGAHESKRGPKTLMLCM
jgi:hypothetical protein